MRLRTGCHRSTALHPTGCTWQGLGIPERAVASLRSAAPTTSHSLAPLTATACLPRRPPPAARKPSNPYTSVGCRGTEPAAEQGRRHVICRWLMESSMTSHACRLHSIHYSRYGLGSPKPGRGAGRYGPVGNLLLPYAASLSTGVLM